MSQGPGVIAAVESALTPADNIEAAYDQASHRIDATFELPYVPHATMEPMNCTAYFKGDSCEVWVPTQAPAAAREIVRQITGLDFSRITINSTYCGGGFGRRIYQDFVAESVQIAYDLHQRGVSAPLKVVWTREDDFRHDYYRPMVVHRVRGGLDGSGKIATWIHHAVGESIFAYITDVFVDSLTIGIASPEKVAAIGKVFGECFQLKPVTLPGGKQVGLADPTSVEGLVTGGGHA